MSVCLLDVNVLIALFDPAHEDHEAAHQWFGRQRRHGWATCPITLNGCVRILSNPAYLTVKATPAEVIGRLADFCSAPEHQFWPDSLSICDATIFRASAISSHRAITDIQLLALAVKHHGRLATFDRTIPLRAVRGAATSHLALLG